MEMPSQSDPLFRFKMTHGRKYETNVECRLKRIIISSACSSFPDGFEMRTKGPLFLNLPYPNGRNAINCNHSISSFRNNNTDR